MSVVMEAIQIHTHYDPTGTVQLIHRPGEFYELHDGQGMTAVQLAESFIAMKVAQYAPAGTAPTLPAQLAPVGELPRSLRPGKRRI